MSGGGRLALIINHRVQPSSTFPPPPGAPNSAAPPIRSVQKAKKEKRSLFCNPTANIKLNFPPGSPSNADDGVINVSDAVCRLCSVTRAAPSDQRSPSNEVDRNRFNPVTSNKADSSGSI